MRGSAALVGGKQWGVTELNEFADLIDEGKTQLHEVLTVESDSMVYRYDFGDDPWGIVNILRTAFVEVLASRAGKDVDFPDR